MKIKKIVKKNQKKQLEACVQINLTKILKMAKAHHRGQDAEID
jgi:hypothetical protein